MGSEASVILRALEEGDLERTHRWHNDPALYSLLINPFRFVSKTAELEWLKRKISYSTSEINLAICLRGKGEHIGNIYLQQIDWVSRKAFLGILIGCAEHRGKGYGQQAIGQVLSHAFLHLNLHRIFLEVLVENTRAIKTYEACGLAVEGRLPKHVFKDGAYHDVLVMGINNQEPKETAQGGH